MNAYKLGKQASNRIPQSQSGLINVIIRDADRMVKGVRPGFDPLTFGEQMPHDLPKGSLAKTAQQGRGRANFDPVVIDIGKELGYDENQLVNPNSLEYQAAAATYMLMREHPGVQTPQRAAYLLNKNPTLGKKYRERALTGQFEGAPYQTMTAGITPRYTPKPFFDAPLEEIVRRNFAREQAQQVPTAALSGPPPLPQQSSEQVGNTIAKLRGGQSEFAGEGQRGPIGPGAIRGHVKGTYDPEQGFRLAVNRAGKKFSMGGRLRGARPYQGSRTFEWGNPDYAKPIGPSRPPSRLVKNKDYRGYGSI